MHTNATDLMAILPKLTSSSKKTFKTFKMPNK